MRAEVLKLDLLLRRRLLLAYAAGLALYVLVIVVLYPQFKDSTSLDNITKGGSAAAALFGVTGALTSPGGWLNGNIYANFFPLIMLLVTIGYGAAAVAGQDEDGTLGLLAVLPVRRDSIVAQKAGTMALQALALGLAVAVPVLVGRSFELAVTPAHVLAISGTTMLMGLDFGLIALAVGAATGSRGAALGAASAVAAVAYLVSSLAPVVHWLRPARYVSPFYWAVGHDQIVSGVSASDWLVLAAVGVCALAAAVAAFRRLDVH
jgi:beta-exotoxin I transport system permease protein